MLAPKVEGTVYGPKDTPFSEPQGRYPHRINSLGLTTYREEIKLEDGYYVLWVHVDEQLDA